MKKDKDNTTPMLTDKEYKDIAKKILYNYLKNNMKLAKNIYLDTTKFGLIVKAVMVADWQWNKQGTIYGYRKQRVGWMIGRILKEMNSKHSLSLQFNNNDFYTKKQKCSLEELDYCIYIENKINKSNILSDKEKKILVSSLIQSKTVREISEDLTINRESVRQTITRSINKIGRSLCVL